MSDEFRKNLMGPEPTLLPAETEIYQHLALGKEAAEARVWAGIHYRFDIDAGQEIGRKVAEKTLQRSFASPTR